MAPLLHQHLPTQCMTSPVFVDGTAVSNEELQAHATKCSAVFDAYMDREQEKAAAKKIEKAEQKAKAIAAKAKAAPKASKKA